MYPLRTLLQRSGMEEEEYKLELKFKFGKAYWADYAQQAIDADPEPRPQEIKRTMSALPDGTLVVTFSSLNLRLIRTATSTLMEYIALTAQIFSRFDPELNPELYTA